MAITIGTRNLISLGTQSSWRLISYLLSCLFSLAVSIILTAQVHARSQPRVSEITPAQPALEQRLARLTQQLEEQRQLYKIPGMAIAIVKNDEVILQRGFGLKNIEKKLPVNANTLFPIASISKPFTAILAGLRVDEGVMDWDDQVTKFLPEYHFTQEGKSLPLTLRDLLSHRSGYGRNDTLWSNDKVPWFEVIKAAPKAKPLADYQSEYHYNNVMYLAAGMATAFDTSFNWESLLQEKILVPLDMRSSTSDYSKVITDKRLSTGYYWHDVDKQFYVLPTQNLKNIAPATGIYSNANDMAKWLVFLLNEGRFNNQQLIRQTTLKEMITPVIAISPTYSYGMGWNLSEYGGETLVEHSGNGEGHSAQMAFLPKSNVGFVLLMNVSITPLQASSINLVFNALLNEFSETNENKKTQDYSAYFGDYIANFEPHKNVAFTFKMHGKKPAVNVPSQTLYILKERNEQGKFYFEIADKVAISFNTDEKKQVTSMILHEPDGDFILPKKEAYEGTLSDRSSDKNNNKTALQEIMSLMHTEQQKKAYERLGDIEIKGTLLQEQSGVSGEFITKTTGKLNYFTQQNFGQFGDIETSVTPESGVNKRLRHSYKLTGKYLEQALREHPLQFLHWDKLYKNIYIDSADDENPKTITVRLEGFEAPNATAVVSKETGETIKLEMTFIDPVWGEYPRSITYSVYRSVYGLNIPHITVINDHETGNTVLKIKEVICDSCREASTNMPSMY